MKDVFLAFLNMSISATWLIAAVMLLRLVLKNAPKSLRLLGRFMLNGKVVFLNSMYSLYDFIVILLQCGIGLQF